MCVSLTPPLHWVPCPASDPTVNPYRGDASCAGRLSPVDMGQGPEPPGGGQEGCLQGAGFERGLPFHRGRNDWSGARPGQGVLEVTVRLCPRVCPGGVLLTQERDARRAPSPRSRAQGSGDSDAEVSKASLLSPRPGAPVCKGTKSPVARPPEPSQVQASPALPLANPGCDLGHQTWHLGLFAEQGSPGGLGPLARWEKGASAAALCTDELQLPSWL